MRAMRGMRGRRARHASHRPKHHDVLRRPWGGTQTAITHSMREVSHIKLTRIIAQGDYYFYVGDYSRQILQWKSYLERAVIIRQRAITRGNTLVLQGINGATCTSRV